MNILLVHADLKAGGGAEAYAMAVAQVLKSLGHGVGILDVHGHRLPDGRDIRPQLFRLVRSIFRTRQPRLLIYALICNQLKNFTTGYDGVFFTFGEGPATGLPTLRILHAPSLFSTNTELISYLAGPTKGRAYLAARQLYALICRKIAQPEISTGGEVVTFCNSNWTRKISNQHLDLEADGIIYPKVTPVAQDDSRTRDPFLFVALGRIVRNKRLEDAIEIVSNLRGKGFPARLLVLGQSNSPYAGRLMQAQATNPYVVFIPNAAKATIEKALNRASYGLHCYRFEHFGIAVAEMISAGCLPFVFNGGGVCELVPDARLRFQGVREAVDKIRAQIAKEPEARASLAASLMKTPAFRASLAFDSNLKRHLSGTPMFGKAPHRAAS